MFWKKKKSCGIPSNHAQFHCFLFNTDERLEQLYNDHLQILELIKNKDISQIKHTYKQHILSGLNTFNKLIETKPHYFIS